MTQGSKGRNGRPPNGVVTFLFGDVEGSTRLWEDQRETMSLAMARHDALVVEAVDRHGGYLPPGQGEGDNALAVFARAGDATDCAIWFQQQLLKESSPEGFALRVRMSLHSGEAEIRGGNYYGPAVNRGARLRSIAHGCQIILSEATRALLGDDLPTSATLRDLGVHRLRDLSRPEQVYQVCHPDLPADFPPLASLQALPNNLPVQLTSFVDREQEMAEVKRKLVSGQRLITITGGGGFGKTRLALQACAELLDEYPDGVWLVELASIRDPELISLQVAHSLGIRENAAPEMEYDDSLGGGEPGRPRRNRMTLNEDLTSYLRLKKLLLILDNCEQVVSGCAVLAEGLLRGCPDLQIVATSREALRVPGEVLLQVPPLSVPDRSRPSVEDLVVYDAVRLFVERASGRRPDFRLTPGNASAVAEVSRRLGGMPLAIELAAARIGVLTPEQIAGRLDDRFRLLTGGARTLRRHQTLQAVVDWSHDLLSDQERTLFRRLSVFQGGFSLDAAESIASGEGLESPEVLDVLFELVNKSLVFTEERQSQARYSMLETVRQYAYEKLSLSGEREAIHARHRDWFLRLAGESAPQLIGPKQISYLNALEDEHENLRAAIRWSVDASQHEEALALVGNLWLFWGMRGYLTEGRAWMQSALALGEGTPIWRGRALRGAGVLARYQGDLAAARAYLEEALGIARDLESRTLAAESLLNLGYVAGGEGNHAEARVYLEESLTINREIGNRWAVAIALNTLAGDMVEQGEYGDARGPAEESLAIMRELDDKWGLAYTLHTLGNVALIQGDLASARNCAEKSLDAARELGERRSVVVSHILLGRVALAEGDYEAAQANLSEALGVSKELGERRAAARSLVGLGKVALHQSDYKGARAQVEEALAAARGMGNRPLVAACLQTLGAVERVEGDPGASLELLKEALAINRELGYKLGIAECLEELAAASRSMGDISRAAKIYGAAERLREAIGSMLNPGAREGYDREVELLREQLDLVSLQEAWAEGSAMTLEDAVKEGLEAGGRS